MVNRDPEGLSSLFDHPDYVADMTQLEEAWGSYMPDRPTLREDSVRRLRRDLLREEYQEYMEAEHADDLVEIADGLGDMLVIIHGTALVYGIDLDAVWNEIKRSNWSKFGNDGKPIKNPDTGKVMKGPNYSPPRIAELLGIE